MTKKKLLQIIGITALVMIVVLLCLSMVGNVYAAGLVDDTVDAGNLYSKYALDNYQLDFYVDKSWDWLPWNWDDGIGKSVMYGLYAITNFLWTVSLYISNATGYVVQEAYRLDFISDTANAIGENIQTLAGISPNGFRSEGFYPGFLLILILILGCYAAYTGLIKRETTKAIKAITNFIMVFILSAAFIAYAPAYVEKINDFSADISNAALSMGTKIVLPNSESSGDSVDLIRNNLFAIQVQQPWLLLQYGSTDIEEIGVDRVEELLGVSPDADKGKEREEIVKKEIEDHENMNMSISKTMNRLGTVVFLLIFNLGISFFVFLLTGIMIFSQILFIIYSMFLPVSFLLSMIPTYESIGKRAITKLFNTIMSRAGITLIITTAFSISTMFYALSGQYPFFLVAFLQIVTFVGIYCKLGDLMGMFSLQSNDSQQLSRGIFRRSYLTMKRNTRRLKRNLRKHSSGGGSGSGKHGSSKDGMQQNSNGKKQTRAKPDRQMVEELGVRRPAEQSQSKGNRGTNGRENKHLSRALWQRTGIMDMVNIDSATGEKMKPKVAKKSEIPFIKQVKDQQGNAPAPKQVSSKQSLAPQGSKKRGNGLKGEPIGSRKRYEEAAVNNGRKKELEKRPSPITKEQRRDRGNVSRTVYQEERTTILNGKPLPDKKQPPKRSIKNYDNAPMKEEKGQVLLNGRPLIESGSKRADRKKKVRS